MKIIFVIILFILSNNCYSQARRDAVWCFGDSAQIDFNQQPPVVSWCSTRSRGTACSISDSLGNPLFYCHTNYKFLWQQGYDKLGVIWNKNNEVMENGDSLVGDGWYKEMVIIPDPTFNNRFYLLHTGVTRNGEIYYSIIDLSYNNGFGKIILKNILLDSLNGEKVTDGLTAIKHGNGRDWWLLFRTSGNNPLNSFHKFLITPSGIISYPIQSIGSVSTSNATRLKFNNRGDKLIIYNYWGLLELFDFDRCSGNLSNSITIHPEISSIQDEFWGAEFSPNDSLLYVSTDETPTYLYQFDLNAPNIYNSKILLDSFSFPITSGSDLKLAIDGKIYRSNPFITGVSYFFPYPDSVYNNYNMNLSVINNPNVPGLGCNYQPYSFFLGGKRTYLGLPNNPYYDMPALGGSVCDTLGLPNGVQQPVKNSFVVYPNPASDKIYFTADGVGNAQAENILIKGYDFTGKLVVEIRPKGNEVDVSELSGGVYLFKFYINGINISTDKITLIK